MSGSEQSASAEARASFASMEGWWSSLVESADSGWTRAMEMYNDSPLPPMATSARARLCEWTSWSAGGALSTPKSCEWTSAHTAAIATAIVLVAIVACYVGVGAGAGLGRTKAREMPAKEGEDEETKASARSHRRHISMGRSVSQSKSPPRAQARRRRSFSGWQNGSVKNFLENLEADVDGMIEGGKEEARKLYKNVGRLNSRYGFAAAIKKLRERRKYKEVVSQHNQGDGLTSIFAPERRVFDASGEMSSVVYATGTGSGSKDSQRLSGESATFGCTVGEDALVARQLAASEFFGWMSSRQIRYLAEHGERCSMLKGESLYAKGSSASFAALVVQGFIHVPSQSLLGRSERDEQSAIRAAASSMVGCEFGPGDFATGAVDLLAAIVRVPVNAIGDATAQSDDTLVVKISADALAALFSAFPGSKDDMLQRTLMRIHRVTFMGIGSLFRSAMPWERPGEQNIPTRCMTPDRAARTVHTQWSAVAADLVSEELGVDVDSLHPLLKFKVRSETLAESGDTFAAAPKHLRLA